MTVTVNTKSYNFDTNPTPNTGRHVGPANTMSVKDVLELRRVSPKPTATFDGVARSSVKFARTVTLSSGKTAEAIAEATFSIPVGTSDADSDSIRDDLGDFLIAAGDGGDLVKKHVINQ